MILYYKTWQILLQYATEVYYKMHQVFYYKMWQVLQNATFITNCDSTMRIMAAVSSDKSIILIFCTLEGSPTHFVLQCDQCFHDGLFFFFHYLLLLERTFRWVFSPSHVRFYLLSISNGPLIQVLIKNQIQFTNLRASVSFYLVCSSHFLQLGSTFCRNAQKK